MMRAVKVERVRKPTYDEFRRHFLAPHRPVVIEGAIDDWPAMRLWNADYIGQRLGDRTVSAITLTDGSLHVESGQGLKIAPLSFAGYRQAVEHVDAPSYVLRLPIAGEYAKLFADFSVPEYCKRRILMKMNLWIGPRGTSSDLHYDMLHNLYAQIIGHRRITLFAPEDTEHLYPYPRRSLNWHHSQVRLENPDLARFPNFARARPYEVEFERGNLLFIPNGWWHRFEALGESIAVNFFWLTPRLAPAVGVAKLLWVAHGAVQG